jgi:hypothetical protein
LKKYDIKIKIYAIIIEGYKMKRIIYLLAVLFVSAGCDKNSDEYSHLRHYISFEGGHAPTSSGIFYDALEPGKHSYLSNLILAELAKYPDGFFDKIGLDTVVIGKNITSSDHRVGGVYDNTSHKLYISTSNSTDSFIKNIFHHELNHCIDYFLLINYTHDWDQWWVLHNGGYVGGNRLQGNGNTNYRPDLPGFLNTYSTLDQWEDRSEMMGFYLTEDYNAWFIEKAKKDELFYQKAVTLFTFYREKLDFNLLDDFLLKVNQ